MKAKRKTVFKGFDYMHCDDFAKLLMHMAAKGWHFKEKLNSVSHWLTNMNHL